MINKIIEYALNNRIVIFIGFLILTSAGVYQLLELPVDVYPDLNAPTVTVVTENPGMAPGDIETLITFPLESTFNSLPHVRRVRSNSALGISLIHVEFEYGTNIYFARQLVSEKLQLTAGQMPEGTIPPFVGPISSMFADAIEFTISGENLYESRDFAEWTLRPRLQTVPGVSNVINFGGLLKQYQVQLDPNQLRYYAITVREVVNALESNNANATGGYLLNGPEEKLIRSMGQIRSIADIENIVLKQHSGIPVYIKNVAKVEVGPFVRRGTAGENGTEVVAVTVQNQYGANVLKTINGVEQVLDDVKQRVAGKFELEVFYTQLTMILKALQNVRGAIFAGAFLVILVLFLFMNNLRSTLLVSMSIPLSSIIAIIFFKLFGLTLNIMTLGGLAIGVGLIVDSSIIMTENIFRNLRAAPENYHQAIFQGAQEVGRPIFFATLILLAVFAPVFTLRGIEGKMFIPLIFAVSAAVFASLLIALTLTPALASLLLRPKSIKTRESRLVTLLKNGYRPLLKWTFSHEKTLIILILVITLIGGICGLRLGAEFMPEMDESGLIMNILLPAETSLEESSRVASLVSRKVAEIPNVSRVVRRTGRAEGADHAEPVNLTESNIVLTPKEDRRESIEDIKTEIRNAVAGLPGVSILLNAPLNHRINHAATGPNAAIAIKVFGENLNTMTQIARDIELILMNTDGVTDVRMEQIAGVPQLQIRLNRQKLARYGLNVADVNEVIEVALNGKIATELIETQRRYDIFVRFQEKFRANENAIHNLLLRTPDGHQIPLTHVAEITNVRNPSIIRRENALRRVMIQCNTTNADLGSVVTEIQKKLKDINVPEGYFLTFGGTYENQQRALRQLTIVVLLTIFIVFSLLVISFKSVRQAVLILINIPLALIGGVIIVYFSGHTLSVPSIVGFIALVGIGVQDGIVLISHINRYRQQGMSPTAAAAQAGETKIRPVLMTTFTTLLGLIPLAFRNGTGSEIQQPLALVIMFGLIFSTLLTLVVLPTLYVTFEKRASR